MPGPSCVCAWLITFTYVLPEFAAGSQSFRKKNETPTEKRQHCCQLIPNFPLRDLNIVSAIGAGAAPVVVGAHRDIEAVLSFVLFYCLTAGLYKKKTLKCLQCWRDRAQAKDEPITFWHRPPYCPGNNASVLDCWALAGSALYWMPF